MKASRPKSGSGEEVKLTGKVIIKKFAPGSKSEHDAIYLETEKGVYQLRRVGANPFVDPELKKLVGKKITATGLLIHSLFVANSVTELP